jgi:streptogramin lyase
MRWLAVALILAATTLACEGNGPAPLPAPRYITSFGAWGTDPGEFENPRAIAVGPDSLLYVGDGGNRRIEVFTQHGDFVRQWPVGSPASLIVVAPDSTVYVDLYDPTGHTNYRGLGRYTRTGQFLGAWNFVNAVGGMEADASGNLYIYGRRIYGPDPLHPFVEGPYIWKLNPQQEVIKKWGYPGPRDTTGWSGGPMTWNAEGNLLVLGALDTTAAVFEFTPDGDRVSAWRIPTLQAHLLEDIACDRSGRVFTSSSFRSLVFMFDSRGRLLTEWNELGEHQNPLNMPAGIDVDASGFLYVVDFSRYRVVKFEP